MSAPMTAVPSFEDARLDALEFLTLAQHLLVSAQGNGSVQYRSKRDTLSLIYAAKPSCGKRHHYPPTPGTWREEELSWRTLMKIYAADPGFDRCWGCGKKNTRMVWVGGFGFGADCGCHETADHRANSKMNTRQIMRRVKQLYS